MGDSSNGSMLMRARPGRVAAIYARMSSDRQRREQTIASQTVALHELAAARGLLVTDDLVLEDECVSGAVLRRPALERLRDVAVEGRFEVPVPRAGPTRAPLGRPGTGARRIPARRRGGRFREGARAVRRTGG